MSSFYLNLPIDTAVITIQQQQQQLLANAEIRLINLPMIQRSVAQATYGCGSLDP
jgi:hypothetical protein